MTRVRVSHVHRSNPSFSIFESDRSVGRRSAVRPVGDRSLRQQSHGRRRSRRGRLLPRWDRRHPFTFRRPTHLARRVANHDRRCRPSYRWAASATTRHTRPMTTPVTVSQSTRQPEARTIPPRPAIVAAPGGRRGEAPGRRTSRRVPASPTISAGDRYRTGESSVIGAGRPPNRRAFTPAPVSRLSSTRTASRRFTASPARASAAPPSPGPVRARRAAVARPSGTRSQHYKFTTNRGRSHAGTHSGRGRAIALGVGPPSRRTGARTHAYRRARPYSHSAPRRRAGGRARGTRLL